MRKIFYSFVLGMSVAAFPALAQVPVIDSGQLAQSMAFLQTAGQQLQQLQQLAALAQQFRNTVGQFGNITGPFQSSGFGSVFAGGGFGLQGLAGYGRFDPCSMGLCPNGRSAPTSFSYPAAKTWTTETFFRSTSGAFEDGRQQLAIRQSVGAIASQEALAVAISARQQIARSAERQAALEQALSSAGDIRGDVQGAAAVASALYQQERERTILLAALLQLMSARQISADVRIATPQNNSSTR